MDRLGSTRVWIARTFRPLRPIYEAWLSVIAAFSWLLARVVLTIAFFTVFTLYGVILRMLGKDPLKRGLSEDRDSYWDQNVVDNDHLADFERQY